VIPDIVLFGKSVFDFWGELENALACSLALATFFTADAFFYN